MEVTTTLTRDNYELEARRGAHSGIGAVTIGGTPSDPSVTRDIKRPAGDGLSIRSDPLTDDDAQTLDRKRTSSLEDQEIVTVPVTAVDIEAGTQLLPAQGSPPTRRPSHHVSNIPPSTFPSGIQKSSHFH